MYGTCTLRRGETRGFQAAALQAMWRRGFVSIGSVCPFPLRGETHSVSRWEMCGARKGSVLWADGREDVRVLSECLARCSHLL